MAHPESLVQTLVLDFCALEAFMEQQKPKAVGTVLNGGKSLGTGHPRQTRLKMEVQDPGRPTVPLRSHPTDFEESKFGKEQPSHCPVVPFYQAFKAISASERDKSRSPGRTPVEALPCGVSPRVSEQERGASHAPFRTTRPRSQAPWRRSPQCQRAAPRFPGAGVPASETPAAGLRETWAMRPAARGMRG